MQLMKATSRRKGCDTIHDALEKVAASSTQLIVTSRLCKVQSPCSKSSSPSYAPASVAETKKRLWGEPGPPRRVTRNAIITNMAIVRVVQEVLGDFRDKQPHSHEYMSGQDSLPGDGSLNDPSGYGCTLGPLVGLGIYFF